MTTATATEPTLSDRARDVLKRAGNPFRNYFARNPDDEVCARYHVPELFAAERDLLHAIIDLYRYDPMTHSEVVPVLGNKGAGKTHLLHSIKHGTGGQWQLLVTPGTYQRDSDFLEYMLFQIIDTLLGGGKQKGVRPLEYVGRATRRALNFLAVHHLFAKGGIFFHDLGSRIGQQHVAQIVLFGELIVRWNTVLANAKHDGIEFR